MKKYPTFIANCATCDREIERDERLRGQRLTCLDCKEAKRREYDKKRNLHIKQLLENKPFRP